MNNPFIFRKIVAGPNFTDRLNEKIEVLSSIKNGENVILFAPRKYGKTSLSRVIVEELTEKGYLVSRINAEYALSKRALAGMIIGGAHSALHPEKKQFFSTIGDLVEHFPQMRIRGAEETFRAVEFDGAKLNDSALLQKAFEFFQTLAVKNRKKLVVIIDEFSSIAKNLGAETVQLIQSAIQNHDRVSYIFLANSRKSIEGSAEGASFYRFKIVELGPIDKKEFVGFITDKFQKTGVAIDNDLVNKLLEFTDGHPYYTQQMCHLIWNIASVSAGKKVDRGILEYAQKYMLDSEIGLYKQMLAGLTTNQIKLLLEISRGNRELYGTEIISRLEMSPSSIQRAFDGLAEREVVFRTEEGIVVEDPLFAKFVMHNIKL